LIDERSFAAHAPAVRIERASATRRSEGHTGARRFAASASGFSLFVFIFLVFLILLIKPVRCSAAARTV